jgi:RNA polymerase sigma-70 factor, ECF subfamily
MNASMQGNEKLNRLIEASSEGDAQSFARLYEQTSGYLLGVAMRIVGNRQIAEDVLQESFVSVWNSARTYRTEVKGQSLSPMTWLMTIVRNKSLDASRKRARLAEDSADDDANGLAANDAQTPSAGDLFERATRDAHIFNCLQAATPEQRQTLALCYYQGLTHQEIAAHLQQPLGTIKAWARRGLIKLKDCIDGARGWA